MSGGSGYKEGKFPSSSNACPPSIWDALNAPSPDWDYVACGDYIVVRMFDEGNETERVLAKIVEHRFVP
jgi:hypothetical protein